MSSNPRIGLFCYDFPHAKTQAGLINLCLTGNKPVVAFAAKAVPLNFYQSKIRIAPRGLSYHQPLDICKHYGIDYYTIVHNSQSTADLIREYDLDIGIILGARILKPLVIDPFRIGVINMHPGILPDNRGLDNIKWSILEDLPVGVTAHLIDSKIDRGRLIVKRKIRVYADDTIRDLHLRVQNLEQNLMLESIQMVTSHAPLTPLAKGVYRRAVPADLEATLYDKFETWKEKYCE